MPAEIVKQVTEAVERNRQCFLKNPEVKKMQDFYEEMKQLGILKKQEYELPQLDTVGASYFNK